MLAMNADVVFWAANGFETPLLTALLLWLLTRVIERGGARHSHCRNDGGNRRSSPRAIRRVFVDRRRSRRLNRAVTPAARELHRLALLACLLPLLLVGVRLAYYGQWMPNTFELRMTEVPDLWLEGLRYVKRFGREHLLLDRLRRGRVRSPARLAHSCRRRRVCHDGPPRGCRWR